MKTFLATVHMIFSVEEDAAEIPDILNSVLTDHMQKYAGSTESLVDWAFADGGFAGSDISPIELPEGYEPDETPFPRDNHKISILWGQDLEDGQEAKTYGFVSAAELAAFTQGVEEAEGWISYETVKEGHVHYFDEDKSNAVEAGYIQYKTGQNVTPPGGEGEWWYRRDAPDGDWFQSAADCLEAEENRQ